MNNYKILPSIFGANIYNLQQDIEKLPESEIEYLHVDMMDGNFVSNIAFGPSQIKDLKNIIPFKFDVHMMVSNPDDYVDSLIEMGVEAISVHIESTNHILRILEKIKKHGIKAGVVLNPGTSLNLIDELLDVLDYVLIMTVNPGLGGQKFNQNIVNKIDRLKQKIGTKEIRIEVDGGINASNIKQCYDAGADLFVVGSYMFNGDPVDRIEILNRELKGE